MTLFCSVDIETTGLDPTHSDVLESAASINAEIEAAKDGLTPLRANWVRNYIGPARFNSAQASRMTGVHEGTGRHWRDREDCRRYAAALIKREASRIMISRHTIIQELAYIAMSDPVDLFEVTLSLEQVAASEQEGGGHSPGLKGGEGDQRANGEGTGIRRHYRLRNMHDLPRHVSRSIKKITIENGQITKVEFHDKIRALQLLGMAYRLFDDKLPGEGEVVHWTGFRITPPIVEEDREA